MVMVPSLAPAQLVVVATVDAEIEGPCPTKIFVFVPLQPPAPVKAMLYVPDARPVNVWLVCVIFPGVSVNE
jgi:hypothetical protein